jgi:cysteine-rich repeat protein
MRKKTHTVALALAAGAAMGGTALSFTSCDSGSPAPTSTVGPDATTLVPGVCGNGTLDLGEQCDVGPDGGPGCVHCQFVCIPDTLNGNAVCDDHNPCNGVERCAGENNDAGAPPHTCIQGTPEPDGTACGNGSTCRNQLCAGAAVCGDGVVENGEECDLGSNNGAGMGCSADCRWTCVAGDATRNCAATSSCAGPGTCNTATHACTAGTPVADGTSCGTNQVCESGSCVSQSCGNGRVEPPEECDFGTGNGVGTGCEADCTFSCTLTPNDCLTPDLCAGMNTCSAITATTSAGLSSPGQKCVVGAPPDGGTCPGGGVCAPSHLCSSANCGNGALDVGEQCDWGAAMNVHGSGCEPDCTFSCSTSPLSSNACSGFDACSAAPQVCQQVSGPGTNPGQKCVAANVLAACASCGGADICVNHTCKAGQCGDGCVVSPETCDPPDPSGRTCDSTCQKVVCGDGVVSGSEQCDDGNTTNLDGCDSDCRFEQIHRATSLQYSYAVDTFCPLNFLGTSVITRDGLSVIQQFTDMDVADGNTSVMFKFSGVDGGTVDLSGTTGPVVMGSLSGTPQYPDASTPDGGTYDGTSDLDWWYTVDPTTIDSTRNPLNTMIGAFTNKTLQAGPSLLGLKVNLSGSPANLQMWNAKISVAVGSPVAPLRSTGGPPGHVASEHWMDGGITSFANGGVGGSGPTGELCGNITALSLSHVVLPTLLAAGGATACAGSATYTSANSLLDVLVQGCTLNGAVVIIAPQQPDQTLASVPFTPNGGGTATPPYVLSASNGATRIIDTCKDSSPTPKTVPLATCLQGLAYSSAFTFQTDRVIIRP